jgi:hypothetical protein
MRAILAAVRPDFPATERATAAVVLRGVGHGEIRSRGEAWREIFTFLELLERTAP